MSENYFVTNPLDMSLTPGTTLQNRKYVIQTVLHQSDVGVMYQAQHAYLERPVALQTLNPSLRKRSDFAELRQQLLSKVPSLTQRLEQGRVLDCFEEDEMPFVVFELTPEHVLPQLGDWFSISATVHSGAPNSAPEQSCPQSEAHETALVKVATEPSPPVSTSSKMVEETQPPKPTIPIAATAADVIAPAPKLVTSDSVALNPVAVASVTQPTVPIPPPAMPAQTATSVPSVMLTQPHRAKAWMPIALVSMCMLGGLVGAGLGLSLRLAPVPQSQAAKRPNVPHRLLFNREQNFPAEANWPISETPLFTADPTPIEEPVYRVSPSIEDYPQPTVQPLPETPQVRQSTLPLPSSQPTIKSITPNQPEVPVDAVEPSPLAPPSRTTTAVPDLFNPVDSAPAAPIVPAPPAATAAPELPAPAASELPIPEAAPPPIPDLPARKPAVLKQ